MLKALVLSILSFSLTHARPYEAEANKKGMVYATEHNGHSIYYEPNKVRKVGNNKVWYSTTIFNSVSISRDLPVVKISDPKSYSTSKTTELTVYSYMDCTEKKAYRNTVKYIPVIGSPVVSQVMAGDRLDPVLDMKMYNILCK